MKTVLEVSQILSISKNTVRRWANENRGKLSKYANPEKGVTRKFTETDMDVLLNIASKRKSANKLDNQQIELWKRVRKLEAELLRQKQKNIVLNRIEMQLLALNEQVIELENQVTELQSKSNKGFFKR